jgi:spore maturation protein CgeB
MTAAIAKLKGVPLISAVNARYKAWKVEHDAASTRRRYHDEAERRQLSVPVNASLRAALSVRLADRRERLKWPKPRDELHIFLAYPLVNWEAVLPEAMARFGRVSQYEWRADGFNETAPDWLARRDLMNQRLLQAFHAANNSQPIDVVVGYVSGYTVAPQVLLEMAAHGAAITNFCFDDKIYWPGKVRGGRFETTASIAHAVDLNLSCDPAAGPKYFAHGGLSMFHPEAADPEWYKPLGLPFEYEVSFVGAAYGWRPKLIEGLRRHGISVACFGSGWPNGAIANGEMNRLYARSRINLGCGGIGYSHRLLCLKGRDFEVPMSGAVYLTQDNPELSLVFDVGREIVSYRNIPDCARIIRQILDEPQRAEQIRVAARTRCLKDHTYTARWSAVFRMLGALDGESSQTVSRPGAMTAAGFQ